MMRRHVRRCRGEHLFKEDLQDVVNDLAVPIRVAHYPASCSKFNPIARRLCSHGPSAWQGGLFDALQPVLGLLHKTQTRQGRSGTIRVWDKRSAGGRTGSDACTKHLPIVFATVLPPWNDWAVPQ